MELRKLLVYTILLVNAITMLPGITYSTNAVTMAEQLGVQESILGSNIPSSLSDKLTEESIRQTLMNIAITADDTDLTESDIDNIIDSLKYALINLGVDENLTNNINFHKIGYTGNTDNINIATDLIWNDEFMSYNKGNSKYNVDGIGDLAISNQGNSICLFGNQCLSGKNILYTTPLIDNQQSLTYDYSIDFGDSFNSAGVVVRVDRSNDILSGYLISINNSKWAEYCGGKSGGIWRFTFAKNSNQNPFELNGPLGSSIELITPLDIAPSGQLHIEANSSAIEVSGGGLSRRVRIPIKDETGSSFGLYSDHYDHNCDSIGKFELSRVNVSNNNSDYFLDLVNNLSWKDQGSLNLVIDINKYIDTDITDPAELGEALARCLNEDIHYVSWGPEGSRIGAEAFVVNNNNKGMFTPLDDAPKTYDNSIEKTAQYIANQFNIGSGHSGLPKTGNNIVVVNPGNQLNSLNNLSNNPVASFETSIDKDTGNIKFTSDSYSKDNNTTNIGYGQGIQSEKWKYKDITNGNSSDWISGKPDNLNNGEYLVQLEAEDFSGNWSEPVTQLISSNTSTRPIADFSEDGDKSYSPAGIPLSEYKWDVSKDGKPVGTYVTSGFTPPMIDTDKHGPGEYQYSLQVTDFDGNRSNKVTKSIDPSKFNPEYKTTYKVDKPTKTGITNDKINKILYTLYMGIAALALILGYELFAYFILDEIK